MKFSVIVPVYHVEAYLEECVDSVLSQTYPEFELILVDDGSTDRSGELCDNYAKKDARVQVIHKENGGQSSARNRGVELATGEYVIFLDSDDKIADKNFFLDLKDAIQPDTDVAVYRYCKYYGGERREPWGKSLEGVNLRDKTRFLKDLVERDSFFCSCWSKTVRLGLLRDHGIVFDESLCCEDMDWYYRVVKEAEGFVCLDKTYIDYRQRAESVTTVFREKTVTDYLYTLKKWKTLWEETPDRALGAVMLASLGKLYCNLLIAYSGNRKRLNQYKKEIFGLGELLVYDLNPRTKRIRQITQLLGLGTTCRLLDILRKVR